MQKHIFLDFNGTIINDVDLCLELLNEILTKQNKKNLTIEEYRNVFTFPIRTYYERAGVDFSMDSYEKLAEWFIQKYQPASLKCGLYPGLIETFSYLKEKGYSLYILSASERHNLLDQCKSYGILPYFEDILGIDNIHAVSKVHIALEYMKEKNLRGEDILFIGDSLHDLEVAKAMQASCMLVSCGHQSKEVLKEGGVPIIDSVAVLRDIVK